MYSLTSSLIKFISYILSSNTASNDQNSCSEKRLIITGDAIIHRFQQMKKTLSSSFLLYFTILITIKLSYDNNCNVYVFNKLDIKFEGLLLKYNFCFSNDWCLTLLLTAPYICTGLNASGLIYLKRNKVNIKSNEQISVNISL